MMLCFLHIVILLGFCITKEDNPRLKSIKNVTPGSGFLDENQCLCTETVCNCSGQGISDIPKNLSANIQILDLSANSISDLFDCCFCSYIKLQVLNLSTNSIARLQAGSFRRLNKLRELILKGNKLCYNVETFPEGVFGDLISLLYLQFNNNSDPSNCEDSDYPDKVLANLRSLKALYLDGLDTPKLGPGFSNLMSLENLTLSGGNEGFCNITSLYNDTFQSIGQIKMLDISYCNLVGNRMNSQSFVPLKNLTELNLSYNYYINLFALIQILHEIREYGVQILKINYVIRNFSQPLAVHENLTNCLPRSITHLEAAGNSFDLVSSKAISHLPSSLKYLNLKNNRFVFGCYILHLQRLQNLIELDLSGGAVNVFPNYIFKEESCSSRYQYHERFILQKGDVVLKLPPKVVTIDLSSCAISFILYDIHVDSNNSLRVLNISRNYFPALLGSITGLNNLLLLNLSHCSISNISEHFFMNLSSLKHLYLDNNNLGDLFINANSNMTLFIHLKNLTKLSLSGNTITKVYLDMLKGLDELEELYMDLNIMWDFNITISHMSNLNFINLSHNQMNRLPRQVRNYIDKLTSDPTKKIRIDLSFNPIHCECQNLELIQWMVSSRAFDPKFENYMCVYPDGSYKIIDDAYEVTLQYLSYACADYYPVFLIVIFSTLIILVLVLSGIVYRFRWHLRYFYYAAYLKLKERHQNLERKRFVYDVFVSYAHQDEMFILQQLIPELSDRGLSVFIHGRDFVVGDYIASNILTAIRESRKTLVVLTKNLTESTWCNYELQMANVESVHSGRQVLVFLIKESLETLDLKFDLLYHIKNNTYIEYPHVTRAKRTTLTTFWDKLSQDLMS